MSLLHKTIGSQGGSASRKKRQGTVPTGPKGRDHPPPASHAPFKKEYPAVAFPQMERPEKRPKTTKYRNVTKRKKPREKESAAGKDGRNGKTSNSGKKTSSEGDDRKKVLQSSSTYPSRKGKQILLPKRLSRRKKKARPGKRAMRKGSTRAPCKRKSQKTFKRQKADGAGEDRLGTNKPKTPGAWKGPRLEGEKTDQRVAQCHTEARGRVPRKMLPGGGRKKSIEGGRRAASPKTENTRDAQKGAISKKITAMNDCILRGTHDGPKLVSLSRAPFPKGMWHGRT